MTIKWYLFQECKVGCPSLLSSAFMTRKREILLFSLPLLITLLEVLPKVVRRNQIENYELEKK